MRRPTALVAVACVTSLAGSLAVATPAFAADTTAVVRGVVTDSAGKPVPGVSVVAREVPFDGRAATLTDSAGRYELQVTTPEDFSFVNVCAGGDQALRVAGTQRPTSTDLVYNSYCTPYYLDLASAPHHVVDLTVYRRGTLRGTVTDPAGAPVAGAKVVGCVQFNGGLGGDVPDPGDTTTTAADGTYALSMPAGRVGVTVTRTGYKKSVYAGTTCGNPRYDPLPPTVMPKEQDLDGIDVELTPQKASVEAGNIPFVAGTPKVGWTLTANPGTWTPTTATIGYQWAVDGAPVPGATGRTFAPTVDHVGTKVSVTVTARARGLRAASRTVAAKLPVAASGATPTITSVHRPYAAGTARVGWTLTANPGTWGPTDVDLAYAWNVGGRVVGTDRTFRPSADHAGATLTLTVTASKKGWTTAARTVEVGTVAR